MKTRILLVDDHAAIRRAVQLILQVQEDVELVGEAESGRMGIRAARALSPDVVILDVSMPGLDGIETARQLLADQPRLRILMFSVHSDPALVAEAFRAGARGYVLKDHMTRELPRAIPIVLDGKLYRSPALPPPDHETGTAIRPDTTAQ